MTSTSVNVGLGNVRSSSKVLKPPGGGTSDLFASPPDQADSPRKSRAPVMTVPLGDTSPIAESDGPVYKPGNDSHSRLFGPPDPPKPRRATQASNILGLVEKQAPVKEVAPVNGTEITTEVKEDGDDPSKINCQVLELTQDPSASRMSRNCVTGDGCDPVKGHMRLNNFKGGNPVTGEGYDSPKNGSSPNMNGNAAAANLRNRVPPGGFSSGLW